jgi:exodeoxyribonuclease VII large subunit
MNARDHQQPLPLFQPTSLTITSLTRYLRELFESDELLGDVWVLGEISNYTRASSGHVYLTLKDAGAALRCVIWRSTAQRIQLGLQNGLAVEAHGSVSVYERDGSYQLYIDAIRPAGQGRLFQEFLRLKARLEAEGLFDEQHKRPVPPFPQRVGLVTSPTGAALQDMLNTFRRRYPLAEIVLSPCLVQGEEAPRSIVHALQALIRREAPDVILVARGGGSLEDLWAFNDEQVVRAVAASPIPVISGVGHETDFTLTDFAADLRAPTPTGASTLATPDRADLLPTLERLRRRLAGATLQQVAAQRAAFSLQRAALERHTPLRRLQDERQHLDGLTARARRAAGYLVELRRADWLGRNARLRSLNPLAVLERGYAVVQRPQGELITRAAQANPGETVRIRLADGTLAAGITAVEKEP